MVLLSVSGIPSLVAGQDAKDAASLGRQAALDSAAKVLMAQYVSVDTARMIAGHLRAQWDGGAYNGLSDSAFAAAVANDLRSVNRDLHLGFFKRVPAGTGGAPFTPPPFLGRVEVLDGNVGLLEFLSVAPPNAEALAALRSAFNKLAKVGALIVDVRSNRGGAAAMNDTLWSYFVPDSQPSTYVWTRSTDATVTRYAVPRRDVTIFQRVPLYFLTSQRTASAAEGLPHFLQQIGRAKVIGANTAGAGHLVAGFPVSDTFSVRVSIARVRNARTGKEWERTGVIPDVKVAPDSALDKALELARKSPQTR